MRRLLIRPGGIGDLIVSLPALESLRADFLEVWVAEQNVPLIRFADAVHSIGSTGLDMLEFAPAPKLVERLRAFDSIISWYGSNRPEFRDAVERLSLPFHFLPALPIDNKLHAVDFYLGQVEHALACSSDLRIPPRPLEDFAIIHPFASSPQKRWPLEKFREVARLLKMPVRWCAGPEEHLPDAVRIDNLYDLACWLARARLYFGNDSGISHLAAAVGTPAIVLFGPTDPTVWAPRGSRVLHPMDKIEPADVVAQGHALRR
jgi:ADP-heptose:LPS heptosyltransferase